MIIFDRYCDKNIIHDEFYITIFIVIEKLVFCGVSSGLCQTNMFYHIWRKGCEGQCISAALQNAIKRLPNDSLPLQNNCSSCNLDNYLCSPIHIQFYLNLSNFQHPKEGLLK